MTDIRFEADDGFEPPLPAPVLGERGMMVEARVLCSGVRVLLTVRLTWVGRGGGCTDLALAAREDAKLLRVAPEESEKEGPTLKSSDARVVSPPAPPPLSDADAFDTTLGRRPRTGRLP